MTPSDAVTGSAAGKRRKQLLRVWSKRRRREFPWRTYSSPWHVLLAEMLLLRTRAEIVAKHVPSLVERFPTPDAMANEELDDVEAALRPLGLRWRARRLHHLAQSIVQEHRGHVPLDFDALIELSGVGPYVASATLSTLTGMKVLLTDTNTVRVAQRVTGLRLTGDVRRRKDVQSAISSLLGGKCTLDDWYPVLDLAATVCRPKNPRCASCPIVKHCIYGLDASRAIKSATRSVGSPGARYTADRESSGKD